MTLTVVGTQSYSYRMFRNRREKPTRITDTSNVRTSSVRTSSVRTSSVRTSSARTSNALHGSGRLGHAVGMGVRISARERAASERERRESGWRHEHGCWRRDTRRVWPPRHGMTTGCARLRQRKGVVQPSQYPQSGRRRRGRRGRLVQIGKRDLCMKAASEREKT